MKKTDVSVPVSNAQRIAARLDPGLNRPYFVVKSSGGGCLHLQCGVRLDETTQRAYCLGCGNELALFDALMNYHRAEQRLVATLSEIQRHMKMEQERKQREKERRPFLREVTSRRERKDMSLKAEPVIGYELTLECGHTQDQKDTRRLNRVTCHTCRYEAAKQQQTLSAAAQPRKARKK